MKKEYEKIQNFENFDFRINEINFENFRGFEKENKISFTTNSKIPDTAAMEEVEWVKGKSKKYLKIIGVYGKNASGKTTAIDAVLQIHDFLNATRMSNIGLKPRTYSRTDFVGNLYDFTLFRNDKPAILTINISSLEIDFIYKLIIEKRLMNTNDPSQKNAFIDINEIIEIKRFKNVGDNLNKEIWNSKTYNANDKNVTNKLFFLQYRVVDAKETSVMQNNLRKYQQNNSSSSADLNSAYKNAVEAYNAFEKLLDDKKYEIAVERIIFSFLDSIIPFDVWNSDGQSSQILISNVLGAMARDFKIKSTDISKLLTIAATTVDKNIEKIEFELVTEKISHNIPGAAFLPPMPEIIRDSVKLTVEMKNGKQIPFRLLSSGVLNFIYQFCLIYFSSINMPKQIHKYIFIDELGSNWHSFMSKQFINIFKNDILENCTLVFTSHNPQLSDGLRNDSVYIIDNERKIIRLSDTNTRNTEKFSTKYYNSNIDWFDSSPSIDDFDNLIDFIDQGNEQ